MINNLEVIKQLLKFESEDDFYFLQILKRKKENPELGSNSLVIKTYYIRSIEHLEKLIPEIISLCTLHNARGCINLNVRSFEKIAFHTLKKVSDIIMNKDFKSVRAAYDSVCGEFGTGKNKSWIIDIDNFDENLDKEIQLTINNIIPIGMKVLANLPTKNGHHIICTPFDVREFKTKYPDIDIHKNNPTILYIP